MSLPADFLDDLRARVGLAAVVGRRVKLTRAGREMKGCCPFHTEKTPSFYVNEDKGFYHCFGCGAHGDAIGFVMAQDGLSFIEAVKSLAAEAGLTVPEAGPPDQESEARAGLSGLLAAAAEWYRAQLGSAAGAEARGYLVRRGVSEEASALFGLGLAPDSRDALSKAMKARFPALEPQQMLDAGLSGEAEGRRYDRFRGRLMFPIHDPRGRVVGFGGRALGDVEPKYLNSPEGPVFHKGRLLYNLHRAAPAARKTGRLLVVEGYMDVVGLARAGIAEAVAPLGTALTEEQMQLAWRIVPEPVLAFDGDGAGRRAGLRAATRALPVLGAGRSLAFVALPAGRDPDDLAREGGSAAVEALLAAALPLERFLFEAEAAAAPLDTPERRAAFRARLKALAGEIQDAELRRDYLATWLDRADRLLRPARTPRPPRPASGSRGGAGPHGRWSEPLPPARAETRAAAAGRPEQPIAMLLKTLSQHPDLVEEVAEALMELPVSVPSLLVARDRMVAGNDVRSLLAGQAALFGTLGADTDLRARIADALASITESHHIGREDHQPRDLSSEDAFAREYARQQALARDKADARRRMTALAIDDDEA